MKINDETPKSDCTFDTLATGACFKLPHGTYYYLKMEPIYDDGDDEVRYNAVFLEDGEPTRFNDDQEVIPLNAEVVIN